MKKKRLLKTVFATVLMWMGCATGAWAQTDVTSMYLDNANFSTGWTTSDVGNGNVKEVTGWTGTSSGDSWYYGGAISYQGGIKVNSATVSSNPSGTTAGGALGLSAGWGCTVRYTQAVTFPAGKYRISYKAYNANADARKVYNYIGFVETGGTEHYGYINNFIPSTWMEDEIILNFTSETSGNISVGIGAVDGGSGSNAKLFVDYIKIEAYNPSESNMVGAEVTPGGWTGNTGTYQNTYPEYYNGSHFTGDAMTSTLTVDNGTYDAYVYFHSHMAWISQEAADGTLNSYINANDVTRSVGIVNNTGFAAYEPRLYHLSDIPVTNSSLVIKVGNSAEGGNWLTVKTEKIVKKTAATLSYGSANFPINGATSVTADYWYAYTVPLTGDYTITSSAASTVYYSQDGTQAASGGTYTSLSLSANTASNAISLTAGALYVKASAATTLTIAAASYSYNVGSATVSHNYVQGGETVTVTYPNAATNNPSASLSVSTSGVKFNNSTPADLTATANGFTFTVPSGLSAATDYTLAIPANIVGYSTGSTYNEAENITIKTPAVFNGTYFLKNSATNQYLARGNDYGTRGYVNDWGNPLKIQTDADGYSTIQFCDNDRYLFKAGTWDVYADQTTLNDNARWTFTLSDGKYLLHNKNEADGKYVKKNSGESNLYTDGTDASQIVKWIIEDPSDGSHLTQMQAVKNAQAATAAAAAGLSNVTTTAALESAVSSWTSVEMIIPDETVTTSAESWNAFYEWGTKSLRDATTVTIDQPGLYKFTLQALGRPASNAKTFPLHQIKADQTQAYVYFGNAQTLLASAFSVEQRAITNDCYQGSDGYYYPNGQASARAFFSAGNFTNTIWVYITEAGDYTYGIQTFGNSKGGLDQWTCWTDNTISLTLYVNGNVDYVKDGVHYYHGPYTTAPALETTDAAPVVDVTGATFTSGTPTVTFTNPNGLVFAKSNQVNASKNLVVGTSCTSLELEKGHPFINPKEFTASTAKYSMNSNELAGGSFATLMVPFNATKPDGSVYALDQVVDLIDGNVRGTSASIEANKPVLVTAAGNYTGSNVTVPVVAKDATFTNGQLVGTYTPMTAVEGSYVLQNHTNGEGVAFYLVGSTKPTVNPFRAYIKAQSSNVKAISVLFDEDGVESLTPSSSPVGEGCIYNVAGQRLSKPQRGVNIINGKKVIVK